MRLRVLGGLAAAIMGVDACAPSQSPPDASVPARATELKKEILERTRAFSQAVLSASASGWSATQVTALADFYDEETIVFPPRGAPLRGRQSVWSYWTRPAERRIVEHAAVAERVDVTNELATEYGRLRITFQVGSASPTRDSATYVSYWRRGGDGIWRKQLDTWW